jgi:hypothetical protein
MLVSEIIGILQELPDIDNVTYINIDEKGILTILTD